MSRVLTAILILIVAGACQAATGLAAAPDQIRPILLGSAMPDVPLGTLDGKPTTLKKQVGRSPAILVFYRGGWCPYCNLQLSELRNVQAQAEALGYRMIAITPDRPAELAKTLGKDRLEYTLVSDSSTAAMRAFGIGYRVDAATLVRYRAFGIDLSDASGQSTPALPVPSVFIVDRAGVVQFGYSHPDYKMRVPGDVVLAAAKAIAERRQVLKPAR